jgi:hypothetical protein
VACESLEQTERISPQTRDYMNKALDSMSVMPDKVEVQIRKAVALWRQGADIRDHDHDYKYSIIKFNDSLQIANEILQLADISIKHKLLAYTRQIGCYIGIAKASHSLKINYEIALNNAYSISTKALELEVYISNNKDVEKLASILYNSICALGIESIFKKKVTNQTKERVAILISKLKLTDIGLIKINKLKDDSDTELISSLFE